MELGESAGVEHPVRWLHGLASVDIDWNGQQVPFGDPMFFSSVFEALREQIEGSADSPPLSQPFYLVQHRGLPDDDGMPPVNLGQFRRVHLATREELASQGVHTVEPLHIMLGVELNRVGRALDAADQLPNGSMGLKLNYDDHRRADGKGNRRLAWLSEFSATPKPYITTLRSARDTARLQLSDDHGDTMDMEQILAAMQQLKTSNPEGYAKLAKTLLDDGESTAGMPPAVGKQMGDSTKPESLAMSELAELRALRLETAQLREQTRLARESEARRELLEMCERDSVIVSDPEGKVDEKLVSTLVSLKLSDEDEFGALYQRLGRATLKASPRKAIGGPPVPTINLTFSDDPETPEQVSANRRLTEEYAKAHKVTYSEARAALRGQHQGA